MGYEKCEWILKTRWNMKKELTMEGRDSEKWRRIFFLGTKLEPVKTFPLQQQHKVFVTGHLFRSIFALMETFIYNIYETESLRCQESSLIRWVLNCVMYFTPTFMNCTCNASVQRHLFITLWCVHIGCIFTKLRLYYTYYFSNSFSLILYYKYFPCLYPSRQYF